MRRKLEYDERRRTFRDAKQFPSTMEGKTSRRHRKKHGLNYT